MIDEVLRQRLLRSLGNLPDAHQIRITCGELRELLTLVDATDDEFAAIHVIEHSQRGDAWLWQTRRPADNVVDGFFESRERAAEWCEGNGFVAHVSVEDAVKADQQVANIWRQRAGHDETFTADLVAQIEMMQELIIEDHA